MWYRIQEECVIKSIAMSNNPRGYKHGYYDTSLTAG